MTKIQNICLWLGLLLASSAECRAQKAVEVHGVASLEVSVDDNITMAEARHESIRRAHYEAIKEKFGELVTSNTVVVDGNIGGEEISKFVEETSLSAQAEWLGDTRDPSVELSVRDGHIVFTAEVWGKAREIPRSSVDFKWQVLGEGKEDLCGKLKFGNRQRFYIKFRTPVSGYVAVYLLDSSKKEANCLLPYRTNPCGQHSVKAGRDYVFFDKESDPAAINYRLTTDKPIELNQVVFIFSPNPFTKCNEVTGDRRHPNSLDIEDFEQWLRRLRVRDKDLVVDRSQWIQIMGGEG